MKTKIQLVTLLIIIALFSACKTQTDMHNSISSLDITENDKKAELDQNFLNKVSTNEITEKYWKLVELNGKPIVQDETSSREPYLIMKKEDNRTTGFAGCNLFTGAYEIGPMNKIQFSKTVSTMMACLNMEIESEFLRVLEMCDNYLTSADGNFLSLNKARMAPLARFEVVYLE